MLPRFSLDKAGMQKKWNSYNEAQRKLYVALLDYAKAAAPGHLDPLAYANHAAHRVETMSIFIRKDWEPDYRGEVNNEP